MNFLFVHGNYPAQFRHLIILLGQDKRHEVIYLTEETEIMHQVIPGVAIKYYQNHRNVSTEIHHYLEATENAILQGQAVIRAINNLTEEGFVPDVAITHSGTGLGLYIKDILPQILHIGYFEWYFQPNTTIHLVENYSLDTQLKTKTRNMSILQELEYCDLGVVPTIWQKNQFPINYSNKLHVIFDGIDTSFFQSIPHKQVDRNYELTLSNRETRESYSVSGNQKILSYATRGMETLRGFPEFMSSLPSAFREIKDLVVVIAGTDRRAYSYDAPIEGGSWKQYMLEKLGDFEGKDRIIFTGLLNYEDYRNLLWRSNLHCYFTRPYVTSWSFFEACACGANIITNRVDATIHIAEESSIHWTEIDNQRDINRRIVMALKQRPKKARLLEGFGLEKSIEKWSQLIDSNLAR